MGGADTPRAVREEAIKYQLIDVFFKLDGCLQVLRAATSMALSLSLSLKITPSFPIESSRLERYVDALSRVSTQQARFMTNLSHDLPRDYVSTKLEEAVAFFENIELDLGVLSVEIEPPKTPQGRNRLPIYELISEIVSPMKVWDIESEYGLIRTLADFRPEGVHYSKIRNLKDAAFYVGIEATSRFQGALEPVSMKLPTLTLTLTFALTLTLTLALTLTLRRARACASEAPM